MKKLKPCRTCGKEVALSAETCPHCGENFPAFAINLKTAAGLIVLGVWGYGIYYFWEDIVAYYKAVFELSDAIKQWEADINARQNAGE